MAQSRIPEPPIRYDAYAIDWFIKQQKKWRKELLKLNLIRDEENSYSELQALKLPQFQTKFNKEFYLLMKRINLTDGIIPNEEDIASWYDILEKDPLREVYDIQENTWGFNYLFTEEDLFSKIENYKTINNFAEDYQKTTGEIFDWLNDLYKLLNKNKCKDYLNKYSLIPNQNGKLLKANEIFGNDDNIEDKIPAIINPIYKEISKEGKEVYDIIIHEKIDLANLDKFINKKNLIDVYNEFSSFFKDDKNDIKKKEYLCNKFISFSINNDKINKMFDFRKDIQHNNEYRRKETMPNYLEGHNLWKDIEEFWFDYHSKIIEEFQNIENLSKELFDNKIDKEKTYEWINNYIKFFKNNSTIIEKKRIFPDKNGNFNYITELRSAFDIPEILIDYDNELNRITECDYDRRNTLLSNKIDTYKGYNKISQKEIISDIESLFNITNDDEDVKLKISEQIMSLLPKNESKKFQTIKKALQDIIIYYNFIFKKKLIQKEEYIMVSLDYGIFVSFILQKIFEKIEGMNDEEIEVNKEVLPKVIKYSWDYQFNNHFRTNIDPKKYKIFLNQYYQQKYLENICIKKDFGKLKYSEIENQIFGLAESSIIGKDYKSIFLSYEYDKELEKDYFNNFNPMTCEDMCKPIDDELTSYKFINYSVKNNKDYKDIFFKLNNIIKENQDLRIYFPKFMDERGKIIFNIL